LDQRVPGLPHHWNSTSLCHCFRQRLRCFDIEDDRLTLARSSQRNTGVNDQQVVAPDDVTGIVDHPNAVGIAVERDSNVGAVLLHRRYQLFYILWNRGIGMVIGERPVTLAEQTAWLDSESGEQTGHHQGSRSI